MKKLREFAEMILNQVSENMGYRGEIVEIPNNNVENRVGLALSEPGNKLSPIVMISDLYEEYKTEGNENMLGPWCLKVKTRFLQQLEMQEDFPDITKMLQQGYPELKNHIQMKLINAAANEQHLKDIPWVPFLDLAITFRLALESNQDICVFTEITNSLLKIWNATSDELYQAALTNLQANNDYVFCDLFDYLFKDMPEFSGISDSVPTVKLYILTNNQAQFGAYELLRPNILKEIADKSNSDLIIFPCSVHELLVHPYDGTISIDYMRETVHHVNHTELLKEDVLSNQVYLYQRKEDRLIIA